MDTSKPHIWSSSTLYDNTMQQLREKWFAQWLSEQEEDYSVEAIRHFHKTAGDGNPISNLITERGFLKTLSVTTINCMGSLPEMIYEDLTIPKTTTVGFNLESAISI